MTRVLPQDEWFRIAHLDVAVMIPLLKQDDIRIVVAEDHNKRIVACWSAFRIAHLEGVWIDPAYRKRRSIARDLLRVTFATAREWGRWAITGATTPDVKRLITKHLRGHKVEGEYFTIPLAEE